MKKVFIDGSSGTTGLRIRSRLEKRTDIELVILPENERKEPKCIEKAINESDITFLCLPDDAAREAAAMVRNDKTVVLDTSTAHRVAPGWVYGFPEIEKGGFEKIAAAKRIAVPGCHASGFISLVRPLVDAGVVAPFTRLTAFSLTGYSGGGKKMIAQYEADGRDALLGAPRQYGIAQKHKHLPEMVKISGIGIEPGFCPIVADFYSGMEVTVTLFSEDLVPGKTVEDVKNAYRELFTGPIVRYADDSDEAGFLSAGAKTGRDSMEISVFGNEERMLLTSRYDNLGKGASGAAIECMNIVLGLAPETGLEL